MPNQSEFLIPEFFFLGGWGGGSHGTRIDFEKNVIETTSAQSLLKYSVVPFGHLFTFNCSIFT